MKIRRLQEMNDQQQWEDHGYALEREDGQCLFRFNTLVWGRIGAEYNAKMKKAGTRLEEVHQVILVKKRLRWLEIEELDGDPEEIMARLDEACQIPRPQKVSVGKPATA
jgi:hypothetical protein